MRLQASCSTPVFLGDVIQRQSPRCVDRAGVRCLQTDYGESIICSARLALEHVCSRSLGQATTFANKVYTGV